MKVVTQITARLKKIGAVILGTTLAIKGVVPITGGSLIVVTMAISNQETDALLSARLKKAGTVTKELVLLNVEMENLEATSNVTAFQAVMKIHASLFLAINARTTRMSALSTVETEKFKEMKENPVTLETKWLKAVRIVFSLTVTTATRRGAKLTVETVRRPETSSVTMSMAVWIVVLFLAMNVSKITSVNCYVVTKGLMKMKTVMATTPDALSTVRLCVDGSVSQASLAMKTVEMERL